MKINTVDENRIEIYLNNTEIRDIFGEYKLIDYDNPDCRIKIHSLFAASAPDTVFPLDCNRVFIEVKPLSFGCVISYTKIYNNTKKANTYTFIFSSSDNLISATKALSELHFTCSELYISGEKYAVIADIKQTDKNGITHLSEYCKVSKSKMDAVKIREYWQPVCKKNAIMRLTNAFLQ